MVSLAHGSRDKGGFNMIELCLPSSWPPSSSRPWCHCLPNALKASSSDAFRVTANNIAQERIEQVRLLTYASISTTAPNDNLNAPPTGFGDGRFGPDYTLPGNNKPYHITYDVAENATENYKKVVVDVTWSEGTANHTTTMSTIIMDPAAAIVSSTSGSPTPTPSPSSTTGFYKITVSFKAWKDVTSKGVKVVRTDVTPNVTEPPSKQVPSAASPTVSWSGLPGGPSVQYVVTCYSKWGTFGRSSVPPAERLSPLLRHESGQPVRRQMETKRQRKRDPQAGLTLMELLITMIVLAIVSTMLIGGSISLQRAYAFTQATNTARAAARDALDRISSELRDCQPPDLTTAGRPLFMFPTPATDGRWDVGFYSSYNQPLADHDGTGIGVRRLTQSTSIPALAL